MWSRYGSSCGSAEGAHQLPTYLGKYSVTILQENNPYPLVVSLPVGLYNLSDNVLIIRLSVSCFSTILPERPLALQTEKKKSAQYRGARDTKRSYPT